MTLRQVFSPLYFTLYLLFFLSGSATLIYQLMWQRMLLTVFGADLISVTIVVSVFMFGLGMGGLLGGYLADRTPTRLLALYVVVELYVAIFGFFSPNLIDFLSGAMVNDSQWMVGVISYLILAVPTLLMGATFPILVTHINRYKQNVGDAVGSLYFANTLGGAMGAYLAGFVLLYLMNVTRAIHFAAWLNLLVALTALLVFRRQK